MCILEKGSQKLEAHQHHLGMFFQNTQCVRTPLLLTAPGLGPPEKDGIRK